MTGLFHSFFFGFTLCIAAYALGGCLQKKTGLILFNNPVAAALMILLVLKVFHISYDDFYVGAGFLNTMLGPATACLAVSIYSKLDLLKKYWLPVISGCLAGVVTSVGSIFLMCRLFHLDRAMTVSLLPKSVTAPIASALAETNGGIVSIAVAAVICTGLLGNLTGPLLVKLFRGKEPMAVGVGLGACAHALGTARALTIGETEGAMSGLAMGLCGLLTALAAMLLPVPA